MIAQRHVKHNIESNSPLNGKDYCRELIRKIMFVGTAKTSQRKALHSANSTHRKKISPNPDKKVIRIAENTKTVKEVSFLSTLTLNKWFTRPNVRCKFNNTKRREGRLLVMKKENNVVQGEKRVKNCRLISFGIESENQEYKGKGGEQVNALQLMFSTTPNEHIQCRTPEFTSNESVEDKKEEKLVVLSKHLFKKCIKRIYLRNTQTKDLKPYLLSKTNDI